VTAKPPVILLLLRAEKAILAALEQLLRSPGLGRRLSDRGRRNAERFDAKTTADRYGKCAQTNLPWTGRGFMRPRWCLGHLGTDMTHRIPGQVESTAASGTNSRSCRWLGHRAWAAADPSASDVRYGRYSTSI
jgi:hypothetical protein